MKNILNRKNLFTSQSVALLIIIAAILLVINLISAGHFARLDLTAEKQYTISAATKNTLKNLDDLLQIKVYFSNQLPPDLANTAQQVNDTLSEYKANSSKISIEYIDPAGDDKLKSEMRTLGIPEVEMQVLEKDEFKVQKGYLGLGLFYADKKEVIPVIENVTSLEYDLTSAIKRLTATEIKTIGFLSGHDEHGIISNPYADETAVSTNDYTTVKKYLDKNYNVTTVTITKDQPITVDTLIVAGPKKELTAEELLAIDQYLLQGGKAIFLLDPVNIVPPLQAVPNKTGLEDLLKAYGLQVNTDLVIDVSNENVGFSTGTMQFFLPYPFWPKLIKDNFLKSNPIVAKLQSLSFPWVSSINEVAKEGVEYQILAATTQYGAAMQEPFNLDPQQDFKPTSQLNLPIVLTAKGQFPTAYPDSATIKQGTAEGQIIAVADSDFVNDEYLQRFPDNLIFFLNAADYLTLDSDLINIRSKNIGQRPLKETSQNLKTWVKVINIILIPLIVIALGVIKFYLRKKEK